MILAKNKNGQVGRMIPSTGFEARVEASEMGEHRGSVYVSTRSIQEDEEYYRRQAEEARGLAKARQLEAIVKRNAEVVREAKEAERIKAFQALKNYNPMNEKLKHHYAKRGMMGETAQVIESLTYQPSVLDVPANFSSSGANPELVPGERMTGGEEWRADFRNQMIVGNPLTRDGEFGPAITDWDRYVHGLDVNQEDIVNIAGGTMLGRYDGSTAPAGKGRQAMQRQNMDGMGDWWDSTQNFFSDVTSSAGDTLTEALPDIGVDWLRNQLLPGQKPPASGTVVVPRPVPGAVTTQIAGMPKAVVYTLIGLGVIVGGMAIMKGFSKA